MKSLKWEKNPILQLENKKSEASCNADDKAGDEQHLLPSTIFKGMEFARNLRIPHSDGDKNKGIWDSPTDPLLSHLDEYQAEVIDLLQDFLRRFPAESKKVMDKVSSEGQCMLPMKSLMGEIGAEYCRILLVLDDIYKARVYGRNLPTESSLKMHNRVFEGIHTHNQTGWYLAKNVLSNQNILSKLFLNTWFARAVLMHFYEDNPSQEVFSQHKAALNYIVRNGNGEADCDKTNLATLGVDTTSISLCAGKQLNRFARYFEGASKECTQWKTM